MGVGGDALEQGQRVGGAVGLKELPLPPAYGDPWERTENRPGSIRYLIVQFDRRPSLHCQPSSLFGE